MYVWVLYENGGYDRIDGSSLDHLIQVGKVRKFHRASGWVEVGVDAIRGMGGEAYDGPERRGAAISVRAASL